MDIVLASRNKKKIKELHTLLSSLCSDINVLSLDDIGLDGEIEENGTTFEENSEIKASAPVNFGYIGIADDSGLAVDALDGAPGVYSARYSGECADDAKNNALLLKNLESVVDEKRMAGFVSVVTVLFPKGSELYDFDASKLENSTLIERENCRGFYCRGECRGRILRQAHGEGGFGYDPLFYTDVYSKTFAELTPEEKNGISHRGEAMKKFASDFASVINGKGILK